MWLLRWLLLLLLVLHFDILLGRRSSFLCRSRLRLPLLAYGPRLLLLKSEKKLRQLGAKHLPGAIEAPYHFLVEGSAAFTFHPPLSSTLWLYELPRASRHRSFFKPSAVPVGPHLETSSY